MLNQNNLNKLIIDKPHMWIASTEKNRTIIMTDTWVVMTSVGLNKRVINKIEKVFKGHLPSLNQAINTQGEDATDIVFPALEKFIDPMLKLSPSRLYDTELMQIRSKSETRILTCESLEDYLYIDRELLGIIEFDDRLQDFKTYLVGNHRPVLFKDKNSTVMIFPIRVANKNSYLVDYSKIGVGKNEVSSD